VGRTTELCPTRLARRLARQHTLSVGSPRADPTTRTFIKRNRPPSPRQIRVFGTGVVVRYRAIPRKVIKSRSNSTICWLDSRPIRT